MKNNTEISERILKIIDYLGISTNEFAHKLGYARSQAIYDILNGKAKPSFSFFENLYNSEYSELFNLTWILHGSGDMLLNKKSIGNELSGDTDSKTLNTQENDLYKELYEKSLSTITELNREIGKLQLQLDQCTKKAATYASLSGTATLHKT